MEGNRREKIDRIQAEFNVLGELELACDNARHVVDPLRLPEGWAMVLPPAVKERMVEAQSLLATLVQDMEALSQANERRLDEAFTELENEN